MDAERRTRINRILDDAVSLSDGEQAPVPRASVRKSKSGSEPEEWATCAFCRAKLAPYRVPARVEFRTEFPKTMVGKVLCRALRESVTPPRIALSSPRAGRVDFVPHHSRAVGRVLYRT
jgi:acyl-coenzyme A synthetase/AMP-(fatty) acid ligase